MTIAERQVHAMVSIHRQSTHQDGEGDIPEDSRQPRSGRDTDVSPSAPVRVVDLAAPFAQHLLRRAAEHEIDKAGRPEYPGDPPGRRPKTREL